MGRLALSCSALARAGQVLSMVTDPAKANEALQQAATILESDAKASRLAPIEAAAVECQSAVGAGAEGERVAACRKLATKLARLASSLATEVQEQSRKAGKVEAMPTAKPAPAPTPVPAVKAAPEQRPAKPKIDLTPIRVAASTEERTAVTAALEAGKRIAEVRNGTLIDTRMNLMWAAKAGPAGPHAAAEVYASQCRLGGYADWRLPQPEELQHFLAGGGRELGASLFGSDQGAAMSLWT